MLNLNFLDIDIGKAKKEHFDFFNCYITKRITGEECETHINRKAYCININKRTKKSDKIDVLKEFVMTNNRLEKILTDIPKDLKRINDDFIKIVDNEFGKDSYEKYINLPEKEKSKNEELHNFFKDVNAIFNYKRLSIDKDYNSYILTSNLGVRSCMYCNRTYAVTHRRKNGSRLMNPQLDHWFPQSKFPLLQVSFYNLIPSCDICNSRVKNDIELSIDDDFHPYQDENEILNFTYFFKDTIDNYTVLFSEDSDKKIKQTAEKMRIDEMYNAHITELKDLILIRNKYSKDYLKSLKLAFPYSNLSENDIYRLSFGVELEKSYFHKRPMSKFKSDILKELKIIDDNEL